MNRPSVSVALCTHNGEAHLSAQLDSLLEQDHENFEIVAVDDASSDRTFELLQAYAARDPRLKVHRNTQNLGYLRNFERAFQLCQGELIAPSDQDDIWLPQKLARLVAARSNASLIYCNSLLVDDGGRSLGQHSADRLRMYSGSDSRAFTLMNCVPGHAMLFTRELMQRALPFPGGYFHDWWLAFVATATGRIAYLDEVLVHWRQHVASTTDVASRRRAPAPKGHRRRIALRQREWLRILSDFPGNPHRAFFQEFHGLWLDWENAWVSPRMARFVNDHRQILYALSRKNPAWQGRQSWQMFWGFKTRALTQPHAYGIPGEPGAA